MRLALSKSNLPEEPVARAKRLAAAQPPQESSSVLGPDPYPTFKTGYEITDAARAAAERGEAIDVLAGLAKLREDLVADDDAVYYRTAEEMAARAAATPPPKSEPKWTTSRHIDIRDLRVSERDEIRSYEAHRAPDRVRLTPAEADPIIYVLSEWSGEVGLSSNFGMMTEALAEQEARDKAAREERRKENRPRHACKGCGARLGKSDRRCDACLLPCAPRALWTEQTYVGMSSSTPLFVESRMTEVERWSDQRRRKHTTQDIPHRRYLWRENILRCWRTLKAMANDQSPHLVVLNALYGDLPPGLPSERTWARTIEASWTPRLDLEYRKVVRYVDGGPSSGFSLDQTLLVDTKRHEGETPEDFAGRKVAQASARAALLKSLAGKSEHAIVQASHAYRKFWKVTT